MVSKRHTRLSMFVLSLLVVLMPALAAVPVSAQKASQNQAVITSAVPDLNGELLFISGQNLPAAPAVTLGLIPLAVEVASATQISAILPFDLHPPGTYLLAVQSSRNNGSVNYATFNVTLGNVGPAGAIGPTGPPGPAGPPGSFATLPPLMCPSGFYLQGINANATPLCVDLNPDITPPTATSITPGPAQNACLIRISVGFSEPMDPLTITNLTFTVSVMGGDLVPGTVTYEEVSDLWIFTPQSPLADNRLFAATITTGVKDLAGNALVENLGFIFPNGGADPDCTGSAR
jgi:hypothetical protein